MATVSGTVKDKDGNFAARMVRAYRRSDGALAGQTISNATTGAYSITTLDGTEHFAVVHDGVVTEGDPYWNNVVLAMHMDDVGLTDAKGKAVTLVGDASRSAAQSKFGGYSAYFDGSGDYLTIPSSAYFALGTGDFTVEYWCYPTRNAGNETMLDMRASDAASPLALGKDGAGAVRCYDGATVRTGGAMTLNTWNHVALARTGANNTVYLNGATVIAFSNAFNKAAAQITVGSNVLTSAENFQGYIADLRITKGVARYTASFTPPTSAFPHGPSLGSPTENALILDNITPL